MRFYQTKEPEPLREIARKTGAAAEELARFSGLSAHGVVPPGVSLLLPPDAKIPLTGGSRLYTSPSEERAQILLCRLGDGISKRRGSTHFGMTLRKCGILSRDGITRMRWAEKHSSLPVVLAPAAWTGELPTAEELAEYLTRRGYRGLLLPIGDIAFHRLTLILPPLMQAFSARGLLLGLGADEKEFLTRSPLFSPLCPEVTFYLLTPSDLDRSLEERAREIEEETDPPLRHKILLSLSSGATWVTGQKSAPLPYGEALKRLLTMGITPRREDLLMAPLTLGSGGGTLYLEDPAALYPGLLRVGDGGFGGLAFAEEAVMPFAPEMIRRLFCTADGRGDKRSHK